MSIEKASQSPSILLITIYKFGSDNLKFRGEKIIVGN